MMDATMVMMDKVGDTLLDSQVQKYFLVERVIRSDGENVFIWIVVNDGGFHGFRS